jgi:predicted dehydrogenase
MFKKIRWGIIGTGSIARKFAIGLGALNEDCALMAVASRTQVSADQFGEEFNVPHRHVGAERMAADHDVDVVYIASPHPMHMTHTLGCLAGRKAVLCEKPFAMNASEATRMVECAQSSGVFLMEAMWTHCFPAMAKIRELVASGSIGEVRLMQSNFCFRSGWNPDGRLFNPALGGGALLDVGVYDLALAQMVYRRRPNRISSMAHLGETGIDEQSAMILGYDNGAMAVLTCAIRTNTIHEAAIYGTEGFIRIPHMFWQPDRLIVKRGAGPEEELNFSRLGNGYSFEAAEVARCLRNGELESGIVPLSSSMDIMKTMDEIRKQWNLVYPMERP